MKASRILITAITGLVLGACAAVAWAQMVLEVIPLKYRTAEEIIPILQPMLAREGSVSGLRGQLVIRTTPANLDELRRILASVDVAPRRLLITVAQDVGADSRRRGAEISGSLRSDDQLHLSIPGTGVAPRDGVQARVFDNRSTENLRVMQTVQTIDGRSAYVQTGQSSPVPERRVTRSVVVNGRVVEQVVDATDYRNLETGFYVTPRVSADRVTLEISSRREALVPRQPGAVDVQRAVTTVSGRLGEWLEVAAVSQERSTDRDALLGRTSGSRAESRTVLLKVDELR